MRYDLCRKDADDELFELQEVILHRVMGDKCEEDPGIDLRTAEYDHNELTDKRDEGNLI